MRRSCSELGRSQNSGLVTGPLFFFPLPSSRDSPRLAHKAHLCRLALYIFILNYFCFYNLSLLSVPLFFNYICTQHQTDHQIFSFLSSQNIIVLHNIHDVKNNQKCVIFASCYSDISLSISKFNCQPCKREIEHTLVICFLDCQNYKKKKKKERKKMGHSLLVKKTCFGLVNIPSYVC